MKKVTMQMIADKVGVAKSVVSVAMSNKYGVSEEMRSKIYLTAHEMGYDFSRTKSSVKHMKNKIALFIENRFVLTETFWSDIILGIENAVSDSNMFLQVFVFNNETHLDTMIYEIHESKICGIILLKDYDNKTIEKLKLLSTPMVVIDPKQVAGVDVTQICVTNYESGYVCAENFIKLNHKKLAFLGDKTFSYSFLQRYNGFSDACASHASEGVTFTDISDKSEIREYLCNVNEVEKVFSKDNKDDMPTAVLCANDILAIMLCEKLKAISVKVPEEVSVCGFDNIEKSQWLNLSTFNVPKFEMGRVAVKTLFDAVENKDAYKQKIELCSIYIERGTVAEFRNASDKKER